MKPHGPTDWYECLKYECELAGVPIPPLARAAYNDAEELIRRFVLDLGRRRLDNLTGGTDNVRAFPRTKRTTLNSN